MVFHIGNSFSTARIPKFPTVIAEGNINLQKPQNSTIYHYEYRISERTVPRSHQRNELKFTPIILLMLCREWTENFQENAQVKHKIHNMGHNGLKPSTLTQLLSIFILYIVLKSVCSSGFMFLQW